MPETKNSYAYPVLLTKQVQMTADASPAHVGRLSCAVDFIIPEGTPVLAALEGIVVDVKQDSNECGEDQSYDVLGNYIEIQHSHGEYSIYEHIRQHGSIVKVGDKVKTGQVIGYSGKTGWIATLGSHLHFEVHTYFGNKPDDYRTLNIRWKKE